MGGVDYTALRADHAAGLTVAACARKHGVSWTHAKRIVAGELGRAPKYRRRKHSDETVSRARELLSAGEKQEWIADVLGVARSTVAHYARGTRRAA